MMQPWILGAGLILAGDYALATSAPAPSQNPPALREIRLVKDLTSEKAEQKLPVQLSGVVTYFDADWNLLMVQDQAAAIFVAPRQHALDLRPGQKVLVQGVTGPGTFAPIIDQAQVQVVGKGTLPHPKPLSEIDTLSGRLDNEWVECTGRIRSVRHQDSHTSLMIATPYGSLNGVAPQVWAKDTVQQLLDATVQIQAVCGSDSNDKRQFTGVRLWIPSLEFIRVIQSAAADPFSAPVQPVASLLQYHSRQASIAPVHVQGVVTLQQGPNLFFVQDDSDGTRVHTRDRWSPQPGDLVEVVGYPTALGYSPVIEDAVVRKIGFRPDSLEAKAATAEKLLSGSLDGELIQVRAHVIDCTISKGEAVLSLQSEQKHFEARLAQDASKLASLRIGSEVRLTGVCQVNLNERREPTSFLVLLRTPSDAVLLHGPSWWTAERASLALGIASSLMLGTMVWISMLRRRVALQTRQIRQNVEQEAALERRYRTLFQRAQDFIFTCDPDGRLTSFNEAGTRLTEFTAEEALHKTIFDLIAPAGHEALRQLLRAPASEHPACLEFELVSKSGPGRVVELTLSFLSEEGLTEIQGIARDVTERRKLAAELTQARDLALQTARQKAEFLANMSHEIRTPMNGVIGMTNLLLDTTLNPQQRDFAQTIRQSAEALLTVVNDILDFSKIEAGKLTFENLDYDLRDAVEGAVEVLAAKADAKSLELGCSIEDGTPTGLRGDAMRLRQVLTNLIGNAVKFTERGEVMVQVRLEKRVENRATLRFEVHDTGIGISEEAQARLFQPFSQADGSSSRRFGGTGLGLAISRQLVGLMGGQIGIQSRIGEGSTFWFTIEAEVQPNPVATESRRHAPLAELRVLIVDDNRSNRQILEHQIAAWRMVGTSAASGAEALEQLRSQVADGRPYDVALLDMQMPAMDGLTLAQAIKGDPALAATRLIVLSSMGHPLTESEMKEAGIAAALLKPVKQSRLFDCLATTMGSRPTVTPSAPPARLPDSIPTERSLRILLAEDNSINQKVALGQLQRLGYRAEVAMNGVAVLEAIKTREFDVILMDCQMPEMDGYETTQRIRKQEKRRLDQRRIHIIAMTAHAMKGDREKCLAAGMDDYVTKPIRTVELGEALARCQVAPAAAAQATDVLTSAFNPPSTEEDPMIDKERLLEAVGGDEQEARALAEFYLEQAREMMTGLHAAVGSNNQAEIERLAHKLAGASASCGIMGLVTPLRELEHCARAGDLARVPVLYPVVQQQYEAVQRELPSSFAELQHA